MQLSPRMKSVAGPARVFYRAGSNVEGYLNSPKGSFQSSAICQTRIGPIQPTVPTSSEDRARTWMDDRTFSGYNMYKMVAYARRFFSNRLN